MARRTASRLIEAGLLLARLNAAGTSSYVLTAGGAAFLQCHQVPARDGYDIQGVCGPTFMHRSLGTMYVAHLLGMGQYAWGEYAINKDRTPFKASELRRWYQKLPDGVHLGQIQPRADGSKIAYFHWIEVENSFKRNEDIDRVTRLAQKFVDEIDDGGRHRFGWLTIVVPAGERHEERIVESFRRVLSSDRFDVPEMVFVVRMVVTPPQRITYLETLSLRDLAAEIGRSDSLPNYD